MTEPTKKISVKNEKLVTIHKNLNSLINNNINALPKDFNQTRFLQNCMAVIMDTPDIQKCESISIARTMLKGAFLGLDFFMRECYAIAYGNTLTFQTDWKGEVKVLRKYSIRPIKSIFAKIIKEGDTYEESIIDGKSKMKHIPLSLGKGKIIGAYAVCLFEDGELLYESMNTQEIEYIRDTFSKQPKGKAWSVFGEMARKTAMRRLRKSITVDFSVQQQQAWDDGGDSEFKPKQIEHTATSSLDAPIDVNAEVVK